MTRNIDTKIIIILTNTIEGWLSLVKYKNFDKMLVQREIEVLYSMKSD